MRMWPPQVLHPNISYEGHISLNVLRSDWKPILQLDTVTGGRAGEPHCLSGTSRSSRELRFFFGLYVIFGIQFLFLEPNPLDPLNLVRAEFVCLVSSVEQPLCVMVCSTLRNS